MEKKRNLWVIPTDKPSRVYINSNKNLVITKLDYGYPPCRNVNIYITNDEEIKEVDWVYSEQYKSILQFKLPSNKYFYKKIILTTDQDLIKDGVQALDNEFLEWFIKNPSCEVVEIDVDLKYFNVDELRERHLKGLPYIYSEKIGYKIIILKEEPKQHVELINDNIEEFDKAMELFKQETLEEVAERLYPENIIKLGNTTSYDASLIKRKDFTEGAKWQQEKSYSDEEVDVLISLLKGTTEYEVLQSFRDKVEQFKKK